MNINKLYIELSSLCNLRCKMCFRNNWFSETPLLMTDKTVDSVIAAVKDSGVNSIFFGGMGEPLLHPRIFEVMAVAHALHKKTELITNGVLLTEPVIKRLLASGLDTLWISMDGFTKESYESVRLGSMYRKITENIAAFNRMRQNEKLGITFVMMKENLGELASVNSFLEANRVDIFNLSHVVPASPLNPSDAIYELPYPVGKMSRLSTEHPFQKELDSCPFIKENTCFIRADGAVSPCMQLLHSSYTYFYEEKRKVYSHAFGNINDTPLAEIYDSEGYRSFRQRVESFEFPCCTVCLGCEDRKENQADCMYNEAPTCGACLWAQGYIRCP